MVRESDPLDLFAVRRREAPALEAFFEEFFDRVYSVAHRLTGNRADAEDLSQEVFLRAHQAVDRLDPERDPWPWLVSITRNLFVDRTRSAAYRHDRQSVRLDDGVVLAAGAAVRPDQALVQQEETEELARALAQLPAAQREAILLRDYAGLSHEEIAAMTGIEAPAARKRYSRALAQLSRLFKESLR